MPMKAILNTAKEKMNKSATVYQRDMQTLRAGRANPQLLDRITVDYYGTPPPSTRWATCPLPNPVCWSSPPGKPA